MLGLTLAAGAVTWLVTLILVESHLTKPLREWTAGQAIAAAARYDAAHNYVLRAKGDPVGLDARLDRQAKARRRMAWWEHAHYFARCHLCLGTWVALVLTVLPGMPRPFGAGVLGWLLAALVVKAVAHLILEGASLLRRLAP